MLKDKANFDLDKEWTWDLGTVDTTLILEPVYILICIFDHLL